MSKYSSNEIFMIFLQICKVEIAATGEILLFFLFCFALFYFFPEEF